MCSMPSRFRQPFERLVRCRCFRYVPLLADENEEIEDWLIALTKARKNWEFGLCYLYLRNIKGFKWNHKRFVGFIVNCS